MAKKNLMTYGLIAAGVVAAILIIRRMNKSKKRSSVEAGPTIKQTETEFYADTEIAPEQPKVIEAAKSVVDIFKGLKRAPEVKAAAQAKRASRKEARQAKRAAKKVGEISILY